MNSRKQSVALITGGNSGIGRAIAEAFVHQNSQVVIVGRNQETLAATSEALGNETIWYQGDVSKSSEVATIVEKIVQKFPKIDVLINAAGFMHTITTTMPLSEAENLWDEVLNVNLKGSFLMSVANCPIFDTSWRSHHQLKFNWIIYRWKSCWWFGLCFIQGGS